MVRHVSLIRFVAGVDDAAIVAVERALTGLPAHVPQIRSYAFGRDLGLTDGRYDFAVVADFDDTEGYAAYRDDPEHRRILTDLVGPILAARAVVQYEI